MINFIKEHYVFMICSSMLFVFLVLPKKPDRPLTEKLESFFAIWVVIFIPVTLFINHSNEGREEWERDLEDRKRWCRGEFHRKFESHLPAYATVDADFRATWIVSCYGDTTHPSNYKR